jgi:hypothetical protein
MAGMIVVLQDMNAMGMEPDEVNYVHIMECFASK